MKNQDEANRWLVEAEKELDTAKWDLEGKKYSACCFWSQQAAEKALKAMLFKSGERRVFEHSVEDLIKKCENFYEGIIEIIAVGRMLDRFYIPTRYPNGLPYPAVPANSYDENDALEALKGAEKIVRTVKKLMGL